MATNKSVFVQMPNGKRCTIKVSLNSTILQILEESCAKYNLNPDEYDIKYSNKILDVNATLSYVRLPNNANLSLVQCKNPRKVSNVTICIQLENGNREMGEFLPNVNIETVLKNLNIEYDKETAVLIFTRREIHSKEFETVTLKSLGLGSGKALFRLLHRDVEQPKEQAHVYIPPTSKVTKVEEIENKPKPPVITNDKVFDPISVIKAEKEIKKQENVEFVKNEKKIENSSNSKITEDICNVEFKKEKKVDETPMDVDMNSAEEIQQKMEEDTMEEPKVEFLGERETLVFNRAEAKAKHSNDVPDTFYDLTDRDARVLVRDAKRRLEKLVDAPLLTSSQIELEKNKEKLNLLNKYRTTTIRVEFPSGMILQGTFKPLETIQSVRDFVKNYLEYPESDFKLYTAPPRCDLLPDERLFDRKLVPNSKIYYSGDSDLKPELKSKSIDPSLADFQAEKIRLTSTRENNSSMNDESDEVQPSTSVMTTMITKVQPSIDESEAGSSQLKQMPQKTTTTKVPKWFKPIGK